MVCRSEICATIARDLLDRGHRRGGVALDRLHPAGDVLGRLRRLLRQLLDLVGHDGEALAGLAGPRRLDRGVQRQQVRLLRDARDDLDDVADLGRGLAQLRHRRGRRLRGDDRLGGHLAGLRGVRGDLPDRGTHLLRTRGHRLHVARHLLRGGRTRHRTAPRSPPPTPRSAPTTPTAPPTTPPPRPPRPTTEDEDRTQARAAPRPATAAIWPISSLLAHAGLDGQVAGGQRVDDACTARDARGRSRRRRRGRPSPTASSTPSAPERRHGPDGVVDGSCVGRAGRGRAPRLDLESPARSMIPSARASVPVGALEVVLPSAARPCAVRARRPGRPRPRWRPGRPRARRGAPARPWRRRRASCQVTRRARQPLLDVGQATRRRRPGATRRRRWPALARRRGPASRSTSASACSARRRATRSTALISSARVAPTPTRRATAPDGRQDRARRPGGGRAGADRAGRWRADVLMTALLEGGASGRGLWTPPVRADFSSVLTAVQGVTYEA